MTTRQRHLAVGGQTPRAGFCKLSDPNETSVFPNSCDGNWSRPEDATNVILGTVTWTANRQHHGHVCVRHAKALECWESTKRGTGMVYKTVQRPRIPASTPRQKQFARPIDSSMRRVPKSWRRPADELSVTPTLPLAHTFTWTGTAESRQSMLQSNSFWFLINWFAIPSCFLTTPRRQGSKNW